MALLPMMIGCNQPQASTGTSNSVSTSASSSSIVSSSSVSSTSSSSSITPKEFNLEEKLNDFKKGIKVFSEVKEEFGSNIKNYYLQSTSKEREFSYILYKDETCTEKKEHEYFASLEDDDYVYSTRLNVSNKYNYYELYNPSTWDVYTWNDGYNNAFLNLSIESFEKEGNAYYLKDSEFESSSDEFSTLFYGNPGLVLTELKVYEENNEIYFASSFEFESTSTYYYEIKTKVLSYGENVEMDYRNLLFDEVKDENFEKMLQDLKGNNYTLIVENYEDDFLDTTSYYYTEEGKIYYETTSYGEEYKLGWCDLEDGTIQEFIKDGDNYYKSGAPMEGEFEELRSELGQSFDISRACFDKQKDGSYTLKDGVEGGFGVLTFLETYTEEFDELKITFLSDGGYQFENVLNDYKTVATFTEIGTTELDFDKDSLLEPAKQTSWSEVLDEQSYSVLEGTCRGRSRKYSCS